MFYAYCRVRVATQVGYCQWMIEPLYQDAIHHLERTDNTCIVALEIKQDSMTGGQ
jgi:hypothetical protein